MHDIKALEKEWTQYNKKRYRPFYFIGLFFLVLLSGIYVYKKTVFLKKTVPVTVIKKSQERVKKPAIVSKSVEKTPYTLLSNSAILSIQMDKHETEDTINVGNTLNAEHLQRDTKEVEIPTLPIIDNIPVIDTVREKKKRRKKKSLKENLHVNVKHKKRHLKILKSSGKIALKDVAHRFRRTHNVDDALFLSKSYYKQKRYLKSEYWALETNKLDANIEDSWIIFVKSKIKLGQKSEAVKILKKYIAQSHSQKAKKLLLKLRY